MAAAVATPPIVLQESNGDTVDRPPTQDLLPETTVAFFQIDNLREFKSQLEDSGIGRMLSDPNVAPLVDDMWGQAQTAYANEVETKLELTLEELQSFPAGEMTIAVIAPRRQKPEYMILVETDPDSESVEQVLNRGRELLQEEGLEIETEESEDGIEFESFTVEGRQIKLFRKDGLLVASTSELELNAFVDRWMRREVADTRPLSENRKFVTIMNRCLGSSETQPAVRFFVDPLTAAKSAFQGNAGAQLTLNFLPVLGLDGLLGVGGSMLLDEQEFQSVTHLHVLLAEPREGVFKMLAFKPTDYQPEIWMPEDISSYMTTSWDVDQMLAELTKMVESFQGEGAVDTWFERIEGELEFDVREELLGGLTGRVTFAQRIQPPMQLTSQVSLIALELKDPVEFEATLDKIIARANRDEPDNPPLAELDYQGVRMLGPSEERVQERFDRRRESRRQRQIERGNEPGFEADIAPPLPTIALVGNHLLISPQSREFIKLAIDTDRGDSPALVNSEQYENVSRKMVGLLKSDMPSGMFYARPSETFRWMLGLAESESTQSYLANEAAESQYVGGIKQAFDNNPLPEFSELEKYFQPQGGFMTSDQSGLHFLFFELQGDPE